MTIKSTKKDSSKFKYENDRQNINRKLPQRRPRKRLPKKTDK